MSLNLSQLSKNISLSFCEKSVISFRKAFVRDIGKNFDKNLRIRVSHDVMTPEGSEFSHAFALSFNEKGKSRSRIESSVKFWNLKVEQISRKSFTCMYASSLSKP